MVNLEKIQKEAPGIVNLAKTAKITLEKSGLSEHTAKVALCLDISGSMHSLYGSGSIQKFAERILALGCNFDDDGSIDIFLFGVNAHNPGELTIGNYKDGIRNIIRQHPLEGGTKYGAVMELIRKHYFPKSIANQPYKSNMPVYVMFVTDGATQDEEFSRKQIKEASYEPIFWQFMAIGKSKKAVKAKGLSGFFQKIAAAASDAAFDFLENLDTMTGRYIDNANFFSVESIDTLQDDELYELLMAEYPEWLKLARQKGLL